MHKCTVEVDYCNKNDRPKNKNCTHPGEILFFHKHKKSGGSIFTMVSSNDIDMEEGTAEEEALKSEDEELSSSSDHRLVDLVESYYCERLNTPNDNDNDNNSLNSWNSSDLDSSTSGDQAREEAIRASFLRTLYTYLGCAMLTKIMSPLEKWANQIWKRIRGSSNADETHDDAEGVNDIGDEVVEEIMNTAGEGLNNFGTTTTTGGGGGGGGGGAAPVPPGPPPGVAEMAAAASQSAASGAASGAAAGAAASTAAATGMAGAVASAGVAGQVGAAISVATVTAAAVTSSVGITTTTNSLTVTDTFVPPVCSGSNQLKEGYAEIQIKGLPPLLPTQKTALESLFRDIYNDITGMCLDPFARVLHSADLNDWITDYKNDLDYLILESNTSTLEEKQTVILESITTTNQVLARGGDDNKRRQRMTILFETLTSQYLLLPQTPVGSDNLFLNSSCLPTHPRRTRTHRSPRPWSTAFESL